MEIPPSTPVLKKPLKLFQPTIYFKWGIEYSSMYLANEYPCSIMFNSLDYLSAEVFYQLVRFYAIDRKYMKAVLYPLRALPYSFGNACTKKAWLNSNHRMETHTRKMALVKFETADNEFNKYRDDVLRLALALKFSQNPSLKTKLLTTRGSRLRESNNLRISYRRKPSAVVHEESKLGSLLEELRDGVLKDSDTLLKHIHELEGRLVQANLLI